MYLKSVTFKTDHRCFKQGQSINFRHMNIIVGDQGCGKSTLLELMAKNNTNVIDINLTDLGKAGVSTFYFDTEKMNPRIKDPSSYADINGMNVGIGFGNALKSRFTSHGETLYRFTVSALKEAKNCVVFLDEPESGLSIRSQFALLNALKEAIERKCQIFVSTHSHLIISNFIEVLSFENDFSWMNNEDFIRSQMVQKVKIHIEPENSFEKLHQCVWKIDGMHSNEFCGICFKTKPEKPEPLMTQEKFMSLSRRNKNIVTCNKPWCDNVVTNITPQCMECSGFDLRIGPKINDI